MRLSKFEYLEPKSIDEACSMLTAHKDEARLFSGGTDLLVMMKQRVVTPPYLVNLKSVSGLSYIEYDAKNGLRIGPLTTLRTITRSPVIKEHFPVLAEAAARVASPLLRNNATLGGNIGLDSKCWYYNQSAQWRKTFEPCFKRGGDVCHVVKGGKRCFSVFCADTVPALIVLGAEIDLVSERGKRTLPLDKFYTGKGKKVNVLEPDEIISEIRIPNSPAGTGAAFIKMATRGSIDYGLIDVAVALTKESNNGRCKDARVCVAAVGPGPVYSTQAAEVLKGQELNDEVFANAGEAAVKEARHISSIWTSVDYRRMMIKTLVGKVAREAWNRA
jgi:4-hydroxybenzoyl-CoA reductase subunit beta